MNYEYSTTKLYFLSIPFAFITASMGHLFEKTLLFDERLHGFSSGSTNLQTKGNHGPNSGGVLLRI